MTQESKCAAQKRFDPFFEVIGGGEWNACVGIQGTAENYVDGYIEAALELASAVIDKRLVASRDTLAMPILYNIRHGLELSLKYAIDRLHAAGAIPQPHVANHDILSHWTLLHNNNIGDEHLRAMVAEIEPYVKSLAAIDDDGQELRYAFNRDGVQSMAGIAIVNLPLVRTSIRRLSLLLGRFKHRVHQIEEERATGTHTSECSRTDLVEIAHTLGDRATWSDPSFDGKRNALRQRFGIGSRKFSQAVNAIKDSRQLAAMVGIETDLKYLSDDKAIEILTLWANAHPLEQFDPNHLGTDYFNRNREAVREEVRIARELDEAARQLLSVTEFADLQALFYLGRERISGEHYESLLERTLNSFHGALEWSSVHHLMSKENLLDSVIVGASAAGRPSLAEKLKSIRRPTTNS